MTPRKLRRRKPVPGKPLVEAAKPNEVWTADFKGEFRTGDHELCYPLTVADHHSRYLLACSGRRPTAPWSWLLRQAGSARGSATREGFDDRARRNLSHDEGKRLRLKG